MSATNDQDQSDYLELEFRGPPNKDGAIGHWFPLVNMMLDLAIEHVAVTTSYRDAFFIKGWVKTALVLQEHLERVDYQMRFAAADRLATILEEVYAELPPYDSGTSVDAAQREFRHLAAEEGFEFADNTLQSIHLTRSWVTEQKGKKNASVEMAASLCGVSPKAIFNYRAKRMVSASRDWLSIRQPSNAERVEYVLLILGIPQQRICPLRDMLLSEMDPEPALPSREFSEGGITWRPQFPRGGFAP